MIDRPVGSIFVDPILGKLEVVESDGCDGCAYKIEFSIMCKPGYETRGSCCASSRKDGKYVKFIPMQQ